MACFIIFPLMTGLAVLAKPLVLVVLTEKWMHAAELLSILCIAYMWYPVMTLNNQILNVKGKSDYYLKAEVIKKIIAIGILIATIPCGTRVLCGGIIIYNLLDCVVAIYYSKKVIRTGYWQQLKNIIPLFLLSLLMGCIMFSVVMSTTLPMLQLVAGIVAGISSYVILSYLFHVKEFSFLSSIFT